MTIEDYELEYTPYIVAIGASTSGVTALQQLFQNLPVNTNAAFVVIQHLPPDTESNLAHIIGCQTSMPVETPAARQRLQPDHVYVARANARLVIDADSIGSTQMDTGADRHLPIDHCFRALAGSHGPRAVGIILSGSGEDGTLGLKAIKAAGGLTMIQPPDDAEFADMPQSAAKAHAIDYTVALDQIGPRLKRYFNQTDKFSDDPGPNGINEREMGSAIDLIRHHTGFDFSSYKHNMLERRLLRRMCLTELDYFADYLGLLRENAGEIEKLQHDLLVVFEQVSGPDVVEEAQTTAPESSNTCLGIELDETYRGLSETIHSLETANEDLRSSNEEIALMNEELQSTNEGLSTANADLRDKVDQLERAQSDFDNLCNELQIATVFLDSDFCIKRYTSTMRPLLNLRMSDIGRPLREIRLNFDDPDLLSAANTVLSDQTEQTAEVEDDNGRFYIRRITPCRTANDQADGVVISLTDVNELHWANQTIQMLADTLPLLLAYLDNNERFLFVNHAANDWLGLTPEQLIGHKLSTIMPMEDNQELADHIATVLQGRRVRFESELSSLDGAHYHASIVLVPDYTQSTLNLPTGFHLLVTNINPYKRRQAALTDEQRGSVDMSQAISMREITDMIVHQLNQPLNAIASYAGVLNQTSDKADDSTKQLADKISEQSHAANRIVDELQLLQNNRSIEHESIEINALIRRTINLSELQIKDADVMVVTDLADNLPQTRGAAAQLEQLLLNLLTNAIEAMHGQSSRRITVSTVATTNHIDIRIDDTGPGIATPDLQRLFEPLYSSKSKGRGLGLSICRAIARDQGSQLWVESSNTGSRFTLRLPLPDG